MTLRFYGKRLDVLKKTPFSLNLFDGYPHLLHQGASIYVLRVLFPIVAKV